MNPPAFLMAAASAVLLGLALRVPSAGPSVRRAPGAWLPAGPAAALQARLVRGGVAVPAHLAVLAVGGVTVGATVIAALVVGSAPLALAGLAAPAVAAHLLLREAERRRPERVAAQLPALAGRIADGLSAGRSLRQALERAAADAPEPARTEFGRVADDMATGDRVEDALAGLASRAPSPDVELLVAAVLVNGRTGGNLARVLAELGSRLDERRRLTRELRGAAAQARMTAWLVGLLPVAAAAVVEAVSPGTLAGTLGSGPGRLAAVLSAAMLTVAVLLIRRIGRVSA